MDDIACEVKELREGDFVIARHKEEGRIILIGTFESRAAWSDDFFMSHVIFATPGNVLFEGRKKMEWDYRYDFTKVDKTSPGLWDRVMEEIRSVNHGEISPNVELLFKCQYCGEKKVIKL